MRLRLGAAILAWLAWRNSPRRTVRVRRGHLETLQRIAATHTLFFIETSDGDRPRRVLISDTSAEDAYFIAKYGDMYDGEPLGRRDFFPISNGILHVEYRLPEGATK